jgi:hypothetical protein
MADTLIDNPILNSPFLEPRRHFKFTDEGITNEIALGRRASSYFIPIARPKKKGKQLTFDTEWTQDRIEEEARIWISGIEAVKAKIGVRAIFDLSATPFFLKGSGYPEGTLFPWVVSDFSLIDAIESGVVKVPQVPVSDDSMQGDQPTYRDLWLRIRDHLPKKGRKTEELEEEPKLPAELEGAIQSLDGNYRKYDDLWEKNADAQAKGLTPPVFIVVCNNTNVSRLVFNYISGWEKQVTEGETIVVPGRLAVFNNEKDGTWSPRPNTILVDSEKLESGEGMSPEFKKIAAREIEEFKAEYRARFPGRDADDLTEEDLLREVMNTVGKPGKLGEHVKCVVSVSMLTEGWDANTVTHVLGVRSFGTQLLCEQVVGRALRRMSYAANADGLFDREYAEVYGVPFSFIPCSGSVVNPKPGPMPTRVRSLESQVFRSFSARTLHRRAADQYQQRPDRGREQHSLARGAERPPDQRGRIPAGQADPGKVFSPGRREPARKDDGPSIRQRSPGLALSAGAGDHQELVNRIRRLQGPYLSPALALDRICPRRGRPHLWRNRGRYARIAGRSSIIAADPPAV